MDNTLHQILDSVRVSQPTRTALTERLQPVKASNANSNLDPGLRRTLAAVIDALLSEGTDSAHLHHLRIPERLEAERNSGPGKGWRYACLPAGAEALLRGLRLLDATSLNLHGSSFSTLSVPLQEELLKRVQEGRVDWTDLDAALWFEELLADATTLYVSHPEVMFEMGYDGFADDPAGWSEVGIGNTLPWEPQARNTVDSGAE